MAVINSIAHDFRLDVAERESQQDFEHRPEQLTQRMKDLEKEQP